MGVALVTSDAGDAVLVASFRYNQGNYKTRRNADHFGYRR